MDPRYRWFQIVFHSKYGAPDLVFHFRGFTVAELRRAGGRPTAFEAEVFLLQQCVAEFDLDSVEHSVSERLLQEIYHVSGWNEHGAPYRAAHEWIQDETGSLEAAAICMIPGLTLQELDTCDPHDRAKYLIMGKWLFETLYPTTVEQAFRGAPKDEKSLQLQDLKRQAQAGAAALHGQGQVTESTGWDSSQRKANILPEVLPELPPKPA